jgi:hypothetical protein
MVGGGVRKLLANSVDFGASDSPEVVHVVAPEHEEEYLFFPSVVGAVVPMVNLSGLPSDLAFTPEALAGIYPPSGVKLRPSERRYKPYIVVLLVRPGTLPARQLPGRFAIGNLTGPEA